MVSLQVGRAAGNGASRINETHAQHLRLHDAGCSAVRRICASGSGSSPRVGPCLCFIHTGSRRCETSTGPDARSGACPNLR